MRRSYLPVLFLIVALLITWVLMNSIHLLVVTPSGSSGSANLGLGKGLGLRGFGTGWVGIGIGRFGFGSGLSGFGHGLRGFGFSLPFTGLTIALPIINVAMPKVNVTMPNVNMTMPKANVGMPFTGLTITLPIIQLPGIHVLLGGGGGGGGGGSGSGSGAVGQGAAASQGTTVKVTTVHVVSITMQWLIYLLIAIIAILIAFSLITTLRNMGGARATVKEETSEEAKGRRVVEKPLVKVEGKPTSTVGEEYQQPNLGGVFVPLRGWGGGKLIKFGIDVDLPLVWRVNEPLPIEVAPGVAVSVSPEGEVGGGYVIFRGVGCHEVSARLGNEAEVHRVLVVDDYTREVVEVFERNILRGDVDHRVMTPREICRELGRRGLLGDGDCLSWSSLRVFEDAKYGGYAMDRARYEEFVRGLYRLRESYVRWCA